MTKRQEYWANLKAKNPEEYQRHLDQVKRNRQARGIKAKLAGYRSEWEKLKIEDPKKYQERLAYNRHNAKTRRDKEKVEKLALANATKQTIPRPPKASRVSSEIRNLTNLSEGKFERELNRICRTW